VSRRWIVYGALGSLALSLIILSVRLRRGGGGLESPRFETLAADLEGTRGVYLHFGVPGTDNLAAEYRDVVVKDRPIDQVRAVYRELISGSSQGLVSPFPEGTELLDAYWAGHGTLYLDWNHALVQEFRGGTGRERQLLAAIARTAGDNLPNVERVMILVDGNPVETIGGHYDVLSPLIVKEWQ